MLDFIFQEKRKIYHRFYLKSYRHRKILYSIFYEFEDMQMQLYPTRVTFYALSQKVNAVSLGAQHITCHRRTMSWFENFLKRSRNDLIIQETRTKNYIAFHPSTWKWIRFYYYNIMYIAVLYCLNNEINEKNFDS